MAKLDKLKRRIRLDKNLLIFLIVLLVIGIIVGSIFTKILSSDDQGLVTAHLTSFLDRIENNTLDFGLAIKNSLMSNVLFVVIVWLLGISVIGLPIMVLMYFSKAFVLGFSVASILSNYGFKGIIFALIYVFGQAIFILFLILLMIYAMSFSFKMYDCLFKKKVLDFKLVINKYLLVLGIVLVFTLLASLYDSYLVPKILKSLISFIK